MPDKKLYIKSYGCQMNVYDSERMLGMLAKQGYRRTDEVVSADLVILNTCHIREKADDKLLSDIGRFDEQMKDDAILTVAGCIAQSMGVLLQKQKPRIDIVIGTQNYHRLPSLIERRRALKKRVHDIAFPSESKFDFLPEELAKTGAVSRFLTIQEGCDKFCTFCVVPYSRGVEFSRPAKDIIDEAKLLIKQGVKEITLLGQNVNGWHGLGLHGKPWVFAELLAELAELQGLESLRYTTSHVHLMDDNLIKEHGRNKKLQPFLHLPLQSGSDKILSLMNRGHDFDEYLRVVEQVRAERADMAFSSDFIVGFPEETEEDFDKTLEAVKQIGYTACFSFCYSPRLGTPAAEMAQLPTPVKKERLQRLQKLLNEQEQKFNQATVGKVIDLLVERPAKHPQQWMGRSPWLQPVHFESDGAMLGQIVKVKIDGMAQHSLFGRLAG